MQGKLQKFAFLIRPDMLVWFEWIRTPSAKSKESVGARCIATGEDARLRIVALLRPLRM